MWARQGCGGGDGGGEQGGVCRMMGTGMVWYRCDSGVIISISILSL